MELGFEPSGGQGLQQHQPQRPCPRCNSNNTKFCYFNNYSLTQPRYFCKGCRRYWTHGGTLRNVPVGGSSRKSKRPRTSNSPQQAPVSSSTSGPPVIVPSLFPFHGGVAGGGYLSSLRGDFPGGWNQGNLQTAATGAQFWTLGGAASSGGGDQCRDFPAVTRGGDDDDI